VTSFKGCQAYYAVCRPVVGGLGTLAGTVPHTVRVRIKETAPYVKGDSASSSYKTAVLENGALIKVPPFVEAEDEIFLDTRDGGSFVKRAG
jgi:elongation factor P